MKIFINPVLYAHLFGLDALQKAADRAHKITKFENGPVITVTDYVVERPVNTTTQAYQEV